MGDRANIAVLQGHDEAVFIYSHWDGLDGMFVKLQAAMKRRQRWDDVPYLTRIIVSEVIRKYLSDETGYGISTRMCDNEYPLLVVDIANQKIGLSSERDPLKPYRTWTFNEFCGLEWSDEFNSREG